METRVKSMGGSSQTNTSVKMQMEKILRPMLIYYSLFGQYFEKNNTTERRCMSLLGHSYCTGVLLIVWVKFFLQFASDGYKSFAFSPELCRALLGHVWHLMCALGSSTVYRACLRRDWQRLFSDWNDLLEDQKKKTFHKRRLRRVVFGASVVLFIVYMTSLTYSVTLSVIGPIAIFPHSNTTQYPTDNGLIRKIFENMTDVFLYFAWLGPITLLMVLCLGLHSHLSSFRSDFREEITSDGRFLGEFEVYRRRHHHICRLIESVDGIFSVYLGLSLITNVGQILMQLYLLIWYIDVWEDPGYTGVIIYWMAANVSGVFCVCLCGGIINHLAHAPSTLVYALDVRQNREIAAEVQMFLSRLNGESIGLTALHMFVIDKPTIVSVCGLILTYFLVLVQFQPST